MTRGGSEEAVLLRLTATLVERGWSAGEALGAIVDQVRPGAPRDRLLRLQATLAAGGEADTTDSPTDFLLATLSRAETVGAPLLRDLSGGVRASSETERQRRTGLTLATLILGLICLFLLVAAGIYSGTGLLYGVSYPTGASLALTLAGPVLFVIGFILLRQIWSPRMIRELEVAAWLHRYRAATAAGLADEKAAGLASERWSAGSPREACTRLGPLGAELFEHLRDAQGEAEACRHLANQLGLLGRERGERFLLTAPLWSAVLAFLLIASALAIFYGDLFMWFHII